MGGDGLLADYCRNGTYEVEHFEAILMHYGTNDLQSNYHPAGCADEIVSSLDHAVKFFKQVNPSAHIGISGILPRPKHVFSKNGQNIVMLEAKDFTNIALCLYCDSNL